MQCEYVNEISSRTRATMMSTTLTVLGMILSSVSQKMCSKRRQVALNRMFHYSKDLSFSDFILV